MIDWSICILNGIYLFAVVVVGVVRGVFKLLYQKVSQNYRLNWSWTNHIHFIYEHVERARPFSFCKGHFHQKILKVNGKILKGTKAKTRGNRCHGFQVLCVIPRYGIKFTGTLLIQRFYQPFRQHSHTQFVFYGEKKQYSYPVPVFCDAFTTWFIIAGMYTFIYHNSKPL